MLDRRLIGISKDLWIESGVLVDGIEDIDEVDKRGADRLPVHWYHDILDYLFVPIILDLLENYLELQVEAWSLGYITGVMRKQSIRPH